ncbi:hypothetical protein HK096_003037 [Nowakowskiella sp. JEL0078]|nr:hypothetical protein HK096_003037 [Nowakowskiella sp. JEL0078]
MTRKFRILILSIPYTGHLNPSIVFSKHLLNAGHDVTFSGHDGMQPPKTFGTWDDIGLKYLPSGPCGLTPEEMSEIIEDWQSGDFNRSVGGLAKLITSMQVAVSRGLLIENHTMNNRPGPAVQKGDFDIVIGEHMSISAIDIGEALEIPHAFIMPTYMIAFMTQYQRFDVPWAIPTMPSELNPKTNILQALITIMTAGFMRNVMGPTINAQSKKVRKELGVPKRPFFSSWSGNTKRGSPPLLLVTTNVGPGLETPRPFLPHIHFIGPLIPPELKLDAELQAWLDGKSADPFSDSQTLDLRPILYISLGTVAVLSEDQILHFLKSTKDSRFRVLWSLRTKHTHVIEEYFSSFTGTFKTELESSFKVLDFVPQAAVFAHPNIKVIVSHGGFNTVTEAMYFAKPIIGVPFFGDQMDNIARCVNAGACIKLNNKSPTLNEEIKKAMIEILNDYDTYLRASKKLSAVLNSTGGIALGIKLVESVAALGSTEHFEVENNTLSFSIASSILVVIVCGILGLTGWGISAIVNI